MVSPYSRLEGWGLYGMHAVTLLWCTLFAWLSQVNCQFASKHVQVLVVVAVTAAYLVDEVGDAPLPRAAMDVNHVSSCAVCAGCLA